MRAKLYSVGVIHSGNGVNPHELPPEMGLDLLGDYPDGIVPDRTARLELGYREGGLRILEVYYMIDNGFSGDVVPLSIRRYNQMKRPRQIWVKRLEHRGEFEPVFSH